MGKFAPVSPALKRFLQKQYVTFHRSKYKITVISILNSYNITSFPFPLTDHSISIYLLVFIQLFTFISFQFLVHFFNGLISLSKYFYLNTNIIFSLYRSGGFEIFNILPINSHQSLVLNLSRA